MADFRGVYHHSLDTKSRMVVPAAFREELGQKFVIVKSLQQKECLSLYPLEEWARVKRDLDNMPSDEIYKDYYRWVYSRLDDCAIDPQNRIIIKETFRKYIDATKNVVVLGAGKTLEIWEESLWLKHHSDEAKDAYREEFKNMPVNY